MDKRSFSERDIYTKFITPALRQAGWDEILQIRKEVSFTKGRIVRGKVPRHYQVSAVNTAMEAIASRRIDQRYRPGEFRPEPRMRRIGEIPRCQKHASLRLFDDRIAFARLGAVAPCAISYLDCSQR